mmetsp:Transcript_5071/g.7656  ORF Transcript_5071/g.7656 Transcript_5071/m.7656 type:complete len:216 (+) Transcript_5071:1461-2108(+)
MKEYDTALPPFINQKNILVFDQNFESGNIDSVYIHNCEEYNMLMKVDSNTKGNTYWFCFRVQNFRVGVRYTFNIFNFTRSIEKFYRDGMNVVIKSTKLENESSKVDHSMRNGDVSSHLSTNTKRSKMGKPNIKDPSERKVETPRGRSKLDKLQGTEKRKSNNSTPRRQSKQYDDMLSGAKKESVHESSKSGSLSSSPSQSLDSETSTKKAAQEAA